MTTTYEYRAHDNPLAMPLGTSTISRHRSEYAARYAAAKEARRFMRSGATFFVGRGWLQRCIVHCEGGEAVEMLDESAYWSARDSMIDRRA